MTKFMGMTKDVEMDTVTRTWKRTWTYKEMDTDRKTTKIDVGVDMEMDHENVSITRIVKIHHMKEAVLKSHLCI